VSYLNLRLCIGVLGVALPVILRIGSAIFPPDPYSISAYYYSSERNIRPRPHSERQSPFPGLPTQGTVTSSV